ncbi:MAG: ATP-binding protein [Spirochaetia bacterium]|jgi:predicted AAA+ superfamily ATPase
MTPAILPRPRYIEHIAPFIGKDIIKVIIGQRRVGKSYFLLHLRDHIHAHDPKARILYINKERDEFISLATGEDLLRYAKKSERSSRMTYLLIDEVQEINGFARALRSLLAGGGYDIYCTGSNSSFLARDIAESLGGRAMEIPLFSLSYDEFLTFHSLKDSDESLKAFLAYGGLPYLIHLSLTDDIVYEYLRNVYNTILFKDVLARNRIRNVDFLERLIRFLADNTGSMVSAKRISDFLKAQRINMSPGIVLNYLSHLEAAFFTLRVPRADLQGKRIFEIGEKFYFGDLGLRHALVGYRQRDIGKIVENAVFLTLLQSGYSVSTGKLGDREIDFICTKGRKKLYVQAAYLIPDEKTRMREFGTLLSVKDNHPKIVVSMDPITADEEGVRHVGLRQFLKSF